MKPNLAIQAFLGLYILIFFLYLLGPLGPGGVKNDPKFL